MSRNVLLTLRRHLYPASLRMYLQHEHCHGAAWAPSSQRNRLVLWQGEAENKGCILGRTGAQMVELT